MSPLRRSASSARKPHSNLDYSPLFCWRRPNSYMLTFLTHIVRQARPAAASTLAAFSDAGKHNTGLAIVTACSQT